METQYHYVIKAYLYNKSCSLLQFTDPIPLHTTILQYIYLNYSYTTKCGQHKKPSSCPWRD